jgi:hypothetical protein
MGVTSIFSEAAQQLTTCSPEALDLVRIVMTVIGARLPLVASS